MPSTPATRRTIDRDLSLEGVGLFTGARASVRLRPGGDGVRFRRADVPGAPALHASIAFLGPGLGRNTGLGTAGTGVATIEHLMSALAALGVTDVNVDCHGPELPIGDGSASPWMDLLAGHGRDTGSPLEPIGLDGPIAVVDPRDAAATIVAEPAPAPSFEYALDYGPGSSIPRQRAAWSGSAESYATDIAPARTFCTAREARAMRAAGLFAHLGPRDMLVLDDSPEGGGRPIDNTLRFPDEPARHKLLDLIGDLWLLGRPLLARVVATRSGHALTHELCRRIGAG